MKVEQDKVVVFHYRSTDEQQQEIEASHGGDPMVYLMGSRGIMPALEESLLGREPGERFDLIVPAHKAYGVKREGAEQRVPIKHLIQAPRKLQPGQVVRLNTENGPREVTVRKVGRFHIDVDLNHPRAGQSIHFAVEVVDVRNATGSELAHGHAHGPGGHAHA